MRARALVAAAIAVSVTVVAAYALKGGGDFEPTPVADPCTRQAPTAADSSLTGTAERVGLVALDGAACDLGVSRERLLLAVAGEERLDVDDERRNDAFREGLRKAVDEEEAAGRLGAGEATLLRAGVEFLPVGALLDRVFSR